MSKCCGVVVGFVGFGKFSGKQQMVLIFLAGDDCWLRRGAFACPA